MRSLPVNTKTHERIKNPANDLLYSEGSSDIDDIFLNLNEILSDDKDQKLNNNEINARGYKVTSDSNVFSNDDQKTTPESENDYTSTLWEKLKKPQQELAPSNEKRANFGNKVKKLRFPLITRNLRSHQMQFIPSISAG